jgi:hypothetical protein
MTLAPGSRLGPHELTAKALVLHTRLRDEGVLAARRVGRALRPHELRSLAARYRLAVDLERQWTTPGVRRTRATPASRSGICAG